MKRDYCEHRKKEEGEYCDSIWGLVAEVMSPWSHFEVLEAQQMVSNVPDLKDFCTRLSREI